MQTKSDQGHEVEGDIARAEQPSVESSQPWWRGVTGFNASPGQLHGSAPTSPPFDSPDKGNGGSGDSPGQENCKNEERRSVNGEDREITSPAGSEGDYAKRQDVQSGTAVMPSVVAEYLVPHPQLELSQPMACAPYIFPETYYNGILSAYGAQPLVHSQLLGMPHTRMPLPLEMAEEPVYVNAKQYHGILRRRQSRAKAELENKLIKVRKPYLHESRHQHAMRRARGCGGRFLNTKKGDAHATEPATEKAPCSNGFQPVKPPTEGSESPPSSRPNNPPTQEARAPAVPDVCTAPTTYGRACETANFNLPAFRSISSDDRKEEGDCSGQQRSGMPVGQAASRAVII